MKDNFSKYKGKFIKAKWDGVDSVGVITAVNGDNGPY